MRPEHSAISPGNNKSLWIATTANTDFPRLEGDIIVDVAIIGGGLVGLTAASILTDAGKAVAVIDIHKIAKRVTGHTTAKVTSLHGYIYQELKERFSEDEIKVYADMNQAAIDKIEGIVRNKKIDCDFKRTSAYTYTEIAENLRFVEAEVEIATRLGLPVSFTSSPDVPFTVKGAVRFESQAQFHPRKYLLGLAQGLNEGGSFVFENTRAFDIEEGEPNVVITDTGRVRATDVILATQFPVYDKGQFFKKLSPHYAYALGVFLNSRVPEGMYYTEDGFHHSFRNQPAEGGTLLIVGGGNHRTGYGGDILSNYREIEKYASEHFDIKSLEYFWSTEDYDTLDGLPYIGKSPGSERIYLATGFGGWGMTNGTASAQIITDMILDRSQPWFELFNPARAERPKKEIKQEGPEEKAGPAEDAAKKPEPRQAPQSIDDVSAGEGAIMEIDSEKVAVYKDRQGEVYSFSAKCTHMGCQVNWNNAELTWDCTCHGSRFSYDGQVIHNPAPKPLNKKEI